MNKILGLDIGRKRIGISISDEMGLIAHPLETIDGGPDGKPVEKIKKICRDNGVKVIVAGLPKNMNNTIGEQAEYCIEFCENLKDEFEIIYEDERLTSRQAERILSMTGRKYTKNKQLVDLKSACLILQQYLDRK